MFVTHPLYQALSLCCHSISSTGNVCVSDLRAPVGRARSERWGQCPAYRVLGS